MIKKINFICLLAIALSGSCVMVADVPSTAMSSRGWGNRVTDAAKLLGVVGIVGLLIAAYAKFKSQSRGHQLGEAPKPAVMSDVTSQLLDLAQQLRTERQERENLRTEVTELRAKIPADLKQWATGTLAERDRSLQQKIEDVRATNKVTTDRQQAEIDARVLAEDLNRAVKGVDTKVKASLAPFTGELDDIRCNASIQGASLKAVGDAQDHFHADVQRLSESIEKLQSETAGVAAALAKMNSDLPRRVEALVNISLRNRSLEKDKQAAEGALSPKASRVGFGADEVHIIPRDESEESASASAAAPAVLAETSA